MDLNLVNKLLLRFMGAYPGSRFAYALQDEKTLALTRHEWIDSLKDYSFDENALMAAFHDAKVIHKDVPSIAEFIELAKAKSKLFKEKSEMERREQSIKIESSFDPLKEQEAEKARQQIREMIVKMRC